MHDDISTIHLIVAQGFEKNEEYVENPGGRNLEKIESRLSIFEIIIKANTLEEAFENIARKFSSPVQEADKQISN